MIRRAALLVFLSFFVITIDVCAAPRKSGRVISRDLSYFSTGEILQYGLDYVFGTFGLRFTASPEVLSTPWYGEFVGRVTLDELPRYVEAVLSPMGLSVHLDTLNVYQIVPTSPDFRALRDTLLVLDTSAIKRVGDWCNMPNCSFALMPSPGSVLLRYSPGFASFVRRAAEAAAPLAVEDVPPVQIKMIIYRYNADTTRTIGIDYPSTYLPLPDLLHSINLYEESGKIDVTARPELHVRPGGQYELFFGSERPYTRSILQESGAISTNTEYRKYGLTLNIDYQSVRDGLHSFSFRLSQSSYNEDGTNILSETKTDILVPLDSALLVASIDGETIVERRRGIPWLCDIPILGRLFGVGVDVHEKSVYQVLFWINGENSRASSDLHPQAAKME